MKGENENGELKCYKIKCRNKKLKKISEIVYKTQI